MKTLPVDIVDRSDRTENVSDGERFRLDEGTKVETLEKAPGVRPRGGMSNEAKMELL